MALGRHHRGQARQQLALVHDAVKQVVRWQRRCVGVPLRHQPASTPQRRRRAVVGRARQQRRPPATGGVLGQRQQVIVAGAEQGALQRTGQRQGLAPGGQHVEHGQQVLDFRQVCQTQVFRGDMRQVQCRQRLGRLRQHGAFAGQHHDVLGQHPVDPHQPFDRARHRAGLGFAQYQLGLDARRAQRGAPDALDSIAVAPRGARRPLGTGQPGQCRRRVRPRLNLGAVIAPARQRALARDFAEHVVDRPDHARRAAPSMVTCHQCAAQGVDDEALRGLKDARLGATEAVDALLGVADDEKARPRTAAARPGIRRQPAVQRMPLQGAGVLELVDQQVAHAGVEPFLHPARQRMVRQQRERDAFEVDHVDQAATALEAGVLGEEDA